MEMGQLMLIRRAGRRFDLRLVRLTNAEVLDCSCPGAAAAALGETPSLRLTFLLVHWNSQSCCLLRVLQRFLVLIPNPAFLRDSR